jgi:hypothetical protein
MLLSDMGGVSRFATQWQHLAVTVSMHHKWSLHLAEGRISSMGGDLVASVCFKPSLHLSWDGSLPHRPWTCLLLQNGANIRARACGTFFRQGGPMYYGEFPLSFAACTGQKDVVAYLRRHGAQVKALLGAHQGRIRRC